MKFIYAFICLIIISSSSLFAAKAPTVTKFTNTKAKEINRSSYSTKLVKGTKIMKILTYWDRPYTLYLEPIKTTYVKVDYPIEEILNKYEKLASTVLHKKGDDYFTISLEKNEYRGEAQNIIVRLKGGKTLILDLNIVNPGEGNTDVSFIDAIDEMKNQQKGSPNLLFENNQLLELLKKEKKISEPLLFDDLKRVVVKKRYEYQNNRSALELLTITQINNQLFYSGTFHGDFSFQDEPIVLTIKKDEGFITNELSRISNKEKLNETDTKTEKETFSPDELVYYGDNRFCIVFTVNNLHDKFESTLDVSNGKFKVQNNVSFYEVAHTQSLFDSF